jgi:hypothetical protein
MRVCGKGYHFTEEVLLLARGPGWDAMGEATFRHGRRVAGKEDARGPGRPGGLRLRGA